MQGYSEAASTKPLPGIQTGYINHHAQFPIIRSTPVAQKAPRNLLTRWDVSSIPANGIFLTKN